MAKQFKVTKCGLIGWYASESPGSIDCKFIDAKTGEFKSYKEITGYQEPGRIHDESKIFMKTSREAIAKLKKHFKLRRVEDMVVNEVLLFELVE